MNTSGQSSAFPPTRWSLVLAAGGSTSAEVRQALETLCAQYWPPIFAFLRRAGHPTEEARDFTQSFFVHLLTSATFANAEANRGRFRSYLLGALKHFLADEQDRQRAQKRGGGSQLLSLDEAAAEINYAWEPADDRTPDQLFERRWALAVMARALDRPREECSLAGKAALFNQLKGFLTESTAPATSPESAHALGMTEANVRMTVTRLRRRSAPGRSIRRPLPGLPARYLPSSCRPRSTSRSSRAQRIPGSLPLARSTGPIHGG